MGVGGQRLVPPHLPPVKRPGTDCTGVWVLSTTAGVDGCGKSHPQRDSTPGASGQYPVGILTTLCRTT
jgi:hypothetical protein